MFNSYFHNLLHLPTNINNLSIVDLGRVNKGNFVVNHLHHLALDLNQRPSNTTYDNDEMLINVNESFASVKS